jgi:hypothetical protein
LQRGRNTFRAFSADDCTFPKTKNTKSCGLTLAEIGQKKLKWELFAWGQKLAEFG